MFPFQKFFSVTKLSKSRCFELLLIALPPSLWAVYAAEAFAKLSEAVLYCQFSPTLSFYLFKGMGDGVVHLFTPKVIIGPDGGCFGENDWKVEFQFELLLDPMTWLEAGTQVETTISKPWFNKECLHSPPKTRSSKIHNTPFKNKIKANSQLRNRLRDPPSHVWRII